ncbi:MAG: hemolysin family protein [Hyphomicrobiales bacterium]
MTDETSSKKATTTSKQESILDDEPESVNASDLDAAPKTNLLQRLKNMLPFRKNVSLRQDLEVVLEQGDADLTFSPEERAMLSNILALRGVRADDIMVPRADIDAVDFSITLGQMIFLFEEGRHSRMPVYRETLDDPIGMVHVKDVMAFIMAQAEQNPQDKGKPLRNDIIDYDLSNVDLTQPLNEVEILRPILFVPPSMPASDIFAKMRTTRTQMALVIDEYGGTDGLVSMEDVVEAIVGDIEDEHDDEEEAQITQENETTWSADARAPLEDVSAALGISVDVKAEEDGVDTLGGLLFSELGRIPVRGEVVRALDNFDFEIVEADSRRIKQIRIIKAKSTMKRRRRRSQETERGDHSTNDEKSE